MINSWAMAIINFLKQGGSVLKLKFIYICAPVNARVAIPIAIGMEDKPG
jgi:hypothetical protein